MKKVFDIFTRSPFALIHDHMNIVNECLDKTYDLVQGFINENTEDANSKMEEISKKEHEADMVKDQIREHLPKSIFLPVAREDILKLLHRQDNIADHCEDVSVLLTIRNTPVPTIIQADFKRFVDAVFKTSSETVSLVEKMKELVETSFSGPSADDVTLRIENICHLEWKSDMEKRNLLKNIYQHEKEIDTVTLLLYMKIIDKISDIADSSENIANAIRLMISK